jgi:hypothetical protein
MDYPKEAGRSVSAFSSLQLVANQRYTAKKPGICGTMAMIITCDMVKLLSAFHWSLNSFYRSVAVR